MSLLDEELPARFCEDAILRSALMTFLKLKIALFRNDALDESWPLISATRNKRPHARMCVVTQTFSLFTVMLSIHQD